MVTRFLLCCSYRTRIKDQGIIKLRISCLDKQINYSARICIPIADWDSKKVLVKPRNEQAYVLNKKITNLKSKSRLAEGTMPIKRQPSFEKGLSISLPIL